MHTWIALFRGINVAAANQIPMKQLAELLRAEGLSDVRTYIQSGNVVFRSAVNDPEPLRERIGAVVAKARGFRPRILVLSAAELQRAASGNPFPEAVGDPRSLHLFFLAERPTRADVAALDRLRIGREAFALLENVFYLHTPDGFHTSKLAKSAERLIRVDATARNWNTVQKLIAIAHEVRG
jgi:uncharacterized protein (DUF1697 family)